MAKKSLYRCEWCHGDPLYQQYHDEEWGVPLHDDQTLFEFLCLEGAQAGLAWITVLKKRAAYKKLFDNFEIKKVARYSDAKLEKLLTNPAIIRNRLKTYAMRNNAQVALAVQQEFGSLNNYFWQWVDHQPRQNRWQSLKELPATSEISDALSKDLKKCKFFVSDTP